MTCPFPQVAKSSTMKSRVVFFNDDLIAHVILQTQSKTIKIFKKTVFFQFFSKVNFRLGYSNLQVVNLYFIDGFWGFIILLRFKTINFKTSFSKKNLFLKFIPFFKYFCSQNQVFDLFFNFLFNRRWDERIQCASCNASTNALRP